MNVPWTNRAAKALESLPLVVKSYIGAGAVDSELREKVMVSVSAVNDCRYCLSIHGAMADLEGVGRSEQEELRAACRAPMTGSLDQRSRLALEYARRLAMQETHDGLSADLKAHFTPEELEEIQAFAHVIIISNEAGNTFDLLLNWLQGKEKTAPTIQDLAFLLVLSPMALPFLGLYGASRAYLRLGS